ncbi:MAG: transglutaminase family protein [Promethearchaeota archaeon]
MKSTKFCDCDNQKIITKAKELTKNDKTPRDAALSIFYFVRDQIPFMGGPVVKASETLEIGNGFCITKSNLQVALLRAVNIPARYHLAHLRKSILIGIIPGIESDDIHDIITYHPWCECYLSNRWISCEALFEKTLVEKLYNKGIYNKEDMHIIDWDGESDLSTVTAWKVEDKGTHDSLDELFLEVNKYFEKDLVGIPPTL